MIFNEDTRVKIPATLHFLKLGYNYQSLKPEDDIDFRTKIFKSRFKKTIKKINKKTYSDSEIETLLLEIHNVISNNDMGKEFYNWLINPNDKDKLIDFDNIEGMNNEEIDDLLYEQLIWEENVKQVQILSIEDQEVEYNEDKHI